MDPARQFEGYEQDFKVLMSDIQGKLEVDATESKGEARKAILRWVEMNLDEADELASQMELECSQMSAVTKSKYQSRVRAAKAELLKFKDHSKKLYASNQRDDLFSSTAGSPFRNVGADQDDINKHDRSRLLAGTALLEDGTRRLQDSHRIALETEDQGAEILRNLRQQREQIENARDTLHTADTSIDRASGTLKKMIRRMYQQRIVTGAIIAVLVILILIILYEKLFR